MDSIFIRFKTKCFFWWECSIACLKHLALQSITWTPLKRWWISKTKEHQLFLNNLFYFTSFGVSCGITSWLWIFLLWCFALMLLPFLVWLFPGLMLPVERINKKRMASFDPFNWTGGQGSKVIANLACHSFLVSQLWGQSHECLVGYVYVCIFLGQVTKW